MCRNKRIRRLTIAGRWPDNGVTGNTYRARVTHNKRVNVARAAGKACLYRVFNNLITV